MQLKPPFSKFYLSKHAGSNKLLILEQASKQNYKVVKTFSLLKIVLDLPINKIEYQTNKFFVNFDLNDQVKSLLFFYLFLALFPYVNYKKIKTTGYFFSFKVVLNCDSAKSLYLFSLFEENKIIMQPTKTYYLGEFKRKIPNAVLNIKTAGMFFFAVESLFDTIYSDLRLKTFYFKTSFIFRRDASFKSVDFFIRQNFLF